MQTADYQYAYDGSSNRTSQTVNGTTTSFSYNGANELTTSGYAFDANGNQTAAPGYSATYNAKDQTMSITPAGGAAVAMTYAGNGQSERLQAGATRFHSSRLGVSVKTADG